MVPFLGLISFPYKKILNLQTPIPVKIVNRNVSHIQPLQFLTLCTCRTYLHEATIMTGTYYYVLQGRPKHFGELRRNLQMRHLYYHINNIQLGI